LWTAWLARRGDKQKIAEAFHVKGSLEDVDFGETFDAAPGSNQPVVYLSDDGERELGLLRCGFKLPDRLLFNVRSEGVTAAKFLERQVRGTSLYRSRILLFRMAGMRYEA
jgi:putative SOS response-associated peptidase YedK